jgi:transcription elongation GreA/GreB family factor
MNAQPLDNDTNGTVPLTRDARRALAAKVRHLREEVVPELAALRQDPHQDSRIEDEYHRAARQLTDLCSALARAHPAEALPDDPRCVEIGETVTISLEDGSLERYLIVHPVEATLGDLRVSAASPLGRALLGRRVGDEMEVVAPAGTYRCLIVSTERQPHVADPPSAPWRP